MNVNVFDFNNLVIRIFFLSIIEPRSTNPNYQLWKTVIFDNIVKSLTKNGEVDEVVLAVDHRSSWRRQFYSGYKKSRKPARDKSEVDWDKFHLELSKLCTDIQYHLPFKVIQIKSAEADDIIGTICLTHPENTYTIISTDEDYTQLCSDNIKVYNPFQKKFIECKNPEKFVIEKCLLGQKKDDIPNIRTPFDWPVNRRRPSFGEASLTRVMREGHEKWLKRNGLEKRFRENKILIDFKMIPKTIQERILTEYHKYEYPAQDKVKEFLKKNEIKFYLDNYDSLRPLLLRMYNGVDYV